MYVIKAKSKKKSTANIPVGDYVIMHNIIEFHPEFADEEAVLITSTLRNADGEEFPFKEVFFNDSSNARTMQFFKYCDAAGIPRREDGLPDIIGCNEKVVLKRRANYRNPVIVERNFIDRAVLVEDELQNP